jgi:regulator of protease activity HflC (stomatin/prohibitin superfamily)
VFFCIHPRLLFCHPTEAKAEAAKLREESKRDKQASKQAKGEKRKDDISNFCSSGV